VGETKTKSSYLLQVAIERMIAAHGVDCVFATFTFAENLTDLQEAKRRWRSVCDWLRRRGVIGAGAWQTQKRGAWHLHILLSDHVAVQPLRQFAMSRGWGSFLNLEPVKISSDPSSQRRRVKRIASYITRYLVRDLQACHERLTAYVGKGSRRGNVRFAWSGGLSAVWRAGMSMWWDINHRSPTWREFDNVMLYGREAVVGKPGFVGCDNDARPGIRDHWYFTGESPPCRWGEAVLLELPSEYNPF